VKSPAALPDASMIDALQRAGLIGHGASACFEPMAGGVSSDIWKVQTGAHAFCIKRALPKLKVAADWTAPVERNAFEVAWYEIVHRICPDAAPRVLMHDAGSMLFAMDYLPPEHYRLWKAELRAGRAKPAVAAEVGRRLARIHAATAHDDDVARRFPRADIFHSIRLAPYLEATAQRHPDLAGQLFALSRRTSATRIALVHGDVSPKNILVGPRGPVFLDAECACIGDPAFDLAFCLKHLLLKCLWTPPAREAFLACFESLADAYRAGIDWEPRDALEQRAATLLPGLFLARVDGKSPVEYLTDEADRERVRRCARALLQVPPAHLRDVLDAWNEELAA
jgi:aminoglycoside phosphotransferase (APT) family kinase protein